MIFLRVNIIFKKISIKSETKFIGNVLSIHQTAFKCYQYQHLILIEHYQ